MVELGSFFAPDSVAIVGASATPGKIGHAIVKNMLASEFKGKIYPINPRAGEIAGLPCYPRLAEVNAGIDLAVIAVPFTAAIQVAEECGKAGIKHLVVISAGFKEIGQEGQILEKKLIDTCRNYSMNLLGPNCVGMMDTHTPINASFSATFPTRGEITFISQSGAMLVAILDWSRATGLGFSKVISLGNKAHLTESHFIEEAADDPHTRVILCYIEDVADGQHFLAAAEKAASKKPVIILKSGTSQAGARAASSHTGALAGSDLAYETAFRRCGVIRARNMPELFDLAVAFSKQPVPAGGRVAVVTNAGGPGILATDAIEGQGLSMSSFTRDTVEDLRRELPLEANIYNPVDVLGDAGVDRYRLALEKALADPGVDSALILVCPTAVTDPVNIARAIVDTSRSHSAKPVFAAYMGGEMLAEGARLLSRAGIPCFTFPEPAITALAGMTNYARYKEKSDQTRAGQFITELIRPKTPASVGGGFQRAVKSSMDSANIQRGLNPPLNEASFNIDPDRAKAEEILHNVKHDGRLVLLGSEAASVAEAYGIPATPIYLANSPEEAAALADRLGYPVAMKVASPKIMHKTDVGGVLIGLETPEAVKAGFIEINENVQKYMPQVIIHGIEVQRLMPKGIEIIIGMSRDVQFGPLVAVGLGGIYVNLIQDISFRLARGLNPPEIRSMLEETKAYTLLRGYRGDRPADLEAVIDAVARVARLVLDFPQIEELDINPAFAYPRGIAALDIKITIS
ncbi:MAG: acetate--CoA ligase alpha subunit [Bacillota bacterium]